MGEGWLKESWNLCRLVANCYNRKTGNSTRMVTLDDWLGCYCYRVGSRVSIFAYYWVRETGRFRIWRFTVTVAVGLGQFQRILSCDSGTGLHTLVIIYFGSNYNLTLYHQQLSLCISLLTLNSFEAIAIYSCLYLGSVPSLSPEQDLIQTF